MAIAESHGVHTSWDDVFAKEGLISNTGGDGAVYRAKTLRDDKPAVLKFVYAVEGDKNATEKSWREVTILRMFHHPSIVELLGTFSSPADHRFAFVLAFEVADTDLFQLLRRRPKW